LIACEGDDIVGAFDPNDASTIDDGAVNDGSNLDGNLDLDSNVDGAPRDAEASDAAFVSPLLGAASPFAVVAGGTVTNTNVTTITGDLGVYPSSTPIGTTPPVVIGTSYLGTPEALAAENAMTTTYNQLAAEPCDTNLTGQDLGGKTLRPGVYCFDSSVELTGTLTLDGTPSGDKHGWVFQIGSTLTTASSAVVQVINGGNLCDAYWQVGSSAKLGTGTTFGGSIVAMASITLNTGSTVVGRVLGRTGSVTLDTNTVSVASCPVEHLDGGD
jgi:type VI secretion system secreted protein VgrG